MNISESQGITNDRFLSSRLASEQQKSALRSDTPYYIVSKNKFFTLFITTFGFYGFYWFYRQWSHWRETTDEEISPKLRALFYVFYTHSLFYKIGADVEKTVNDKASIKKITFKEIGFAKDDPKEVFAYIKDNMDMKLLWAANIYVAITIINFFVDAPLMIGIAHLTTSLLYVSSLAFLIWQAQTQANVASLDTLGQKNNRFTFANYMWIGLGVSIWLLIIVNVLAHPFTEYKNWVWRGWQLIYPTVLEFANKYNLK